MSVRTWLAAKLDPPKMERRSGTSSGADLIHGEFQREYQEKWQGDTKWDTIDDMESDAHVKGALRAATLPLLTAEWEYKAASDSSRDQEIAEFCNAVLLGKGSDRFGSEFFVQTPWKQRLRETLQMLPDGRSMFVSTRRVVKGKWVHSRLQWIEPRTQDMAAMPWVFDRFDNILGIQRTYVRSDGEWITNEFIPASRLHLFTHEMLGARYDGRSFFRSMFPGWFQKDFLNKREMLLAQKQGAPIPIVNYPREYTNDDKNRAVEVAQAARGTSPDRGWFAGPRGEDGKGLEITYPGVEANIDRFVNSVSAKNQEIGHAGSSSSAMLGETESGSRALGETKGRNELKHHESIIESIQIFDMQGCGNLRGPAEALVHWNYAGVKEMPRLTATGYDPFEEQGNQEALIKGWETGLVPHVAAVRKQYCERNGLELDEDDYEIEDVPALNSPQPQGTPQSKQPGDRQGDSDADPKPGTSNENKGDVRAQGGALTAAEFKVHVAQLLEPADG